MKNCKNCAISLDQQTLRKRVRKDQEYCSLSCAVKSRIYTDYLINNCQYCGNQLSRKQLWKKGLFCSISCARRAMKKAEIAKFCIFCDGEYKSWPSQNKSFCSRKCYIDWLEERKKESGYTRRNSSGIGGYRTDIGIYVRSRWEANFARILKFLNIPVIYEPRSYEVILYDGFKTVYTPDFQIDDYFIEIKGWWRRSQRERERIYAFEKKYNKSVDIVDAPRYKFIEDVYSKHIPNWEYSGDPEPEKPKKFCPICEKQVKSAIRKTVYCSIQCAGIAKRKPESEYSEPRRWIN